MSQEFTISVVTMLTDNQDGGYSVEVFPNETALLNEHPALEEFDPEEDKEEYAERARQILEGDDEYENGYIDTGTIKVRISEGGKVELAENLYFHAGQ